MSSKPIQSSDINLIKDKSSKSLLDFPKVNINNDDFDNLLGKQNFNQQGFMRSINCSLNCTFGCK